MSDTTLEHFIRAAEDIGVNGGNDTLPFDIDNRFVKDQGQELAEIAYSYFSELNAMSKREARQAITALTVFSERLLVPTGPAGFRITTMLHPFWNIYFNGLGISIAEKHEPSRHDNAHSYRYVATGNKLFDKSRSWRSYLEASVNDDEFKKDGAVVVRTDISNFYEHIYHHRVENCINDLFSSNSTVASQIDGLLSKFASGRSFGLPVGGQCSRILAELLMSSIDQNLSAKGVVWHRYVDDFVIISESQEKAYQALSVLSHVLADYGLSLNRSKTTMLSAKHYGDYIRAQLGATDEQSKALQEIDLHFDPYSDSADQDYNDLKETVQSLNISALLDLELEKSQPETFLVSQIARTLKFHKPDIAIQLCSTMLNAKNLHAFRASWSTIMRGVAAVRSDEANSQIFDDLDTLLDEVSINCSHLLQAESSCLHYLRAIRLSRTEQRAKFVLSVYDSTNSETVKRACIDCWHTWKDRPRFITLRNQWPSLGSQEQRLIWLAFYDLGDEGRHARNQIKLSLANDWALGIETDQRRSFYEVYKSWATP